jgi:hypothetical protein
MIWAILAFLGVPLWLCAAGILVVVLNNRRLRKRHGDIPVRVMRPGKQRWTRGHALWVSDVFAWRGSPAAWNEDLEQIITGSERASRSPCWPRRTATPLRWPQAPSRPPPFLDPSRHGHRARSEPPEVLPPATRRQADSARPQQVK